ncbi:hypothetical protein ACFX5Q_25760 [Mesorhizobium sp. IMUNJ 23033]|uniref:hypothetical protein n=1 Tax=Mesorhizobium sp. IMUNJ 23033 TaxID=3378039 RepID=UPI00384FA172
MGELLPLDVELNVSALELFYLGCSGYADIGRFSVYGPSRGVVIQHIRYSNPFDIVGLLKDVPKGIADFILDRTLFYRQEAQRRDLANAKSQEEIISLKLDNVEKARHLRKQFIEDGGSSEIVTQALGEILSDQGANVKVIKPPTRLPMRRNRGRKG